MATVPGSTTVSVSADSVSEMQQAIQRHVRYSMGRNWKNLSGQELFTAVALAIRDRLVDGMIETEERYRRNGAKRLHYLSMEFLIGRSLGNNLLNLGLFETAREALDRMGVDLEEVREGENDAALGNGGLGRLAACFLDSLATLDMPGFGYGINYEYGLFRQQIANGQQRERPDQWRSFGTPWLIERPDQACIVPAYGRLEHTSDREGGYNPMWMDWSILIGVPYDMPIVGYGGRTVNTLRLYSARSSHEFDMGIFNGGDYLRAVERKVASETISKVLYPSDSVEAGRELRLLQEYFFIACALWDITQKFFQENEEIERFPERTAIQLNDTHPALAIAELMRILVDERALEWEKAWALTVKTFGYTNHTLLPEALEKWPVCLLRRVVPRHLQIIEEINDRFLKRIERIWPGDEKRRQRMAVIEEDDEKRVRMAHLAIVGSHSVNGVADLHSELIKKNLVPDFFEMWPEKFNNKTNGVTQRRWLLKANPELSDLINRTIGDGWITDLDRLRGLDAHAEDTAFQEEFRRIKRENKVRLGKLIRETTQEEVDPDSIFDCQVKRIHEYKRQLLNVMQIVHQYFTIIEDGRDIGVPRTYVFAGKAAPGYWAAKQVIRLIHGVGSVVNNDKRVRGRLRVVFIPDYRVSLAEKIIPAADVSEQISTAGMEASGTGNMKFSMNGALTVGTLDGANIEIMQEVGAENIFIFGLRAEEIEEMRRNGGYNTWNYYSNNHYVRRVMDAINSDLFCPTREPDLYKWIFESLVNQQDPYFHLADLPSYIDTQEKVTRLYRRPDEWAAKAIHNVARIGKFSSDRTISAYAREIWGIETQR
ncbi:MAG: glycogen/starch/alpha-glucan phosphorylase [Candidatus Eisenbacteria bacterium]|nr:glycogen/starch/alpha-glucan phosphorylase [Candidatus Eisenbacteria bacterium]